VDENAGTVLVVIKDTFSDLLHVGHLPAYAVQYLHKNGAILTAKPIDALLSYRTLQGVIQSRSFNTNT
jgi:hypothetical protein